MKNKKRGTVNGVICQVGTVLAALHLIEREQIIHVKRLNRCVFPMSLQF